MRKERIGKRRSKRMRGLYTYDGKNSAKGIGIRICGYLIGKS